MPDVVTPEALAYLAGLFDGEGCIYIQAKKPSGNSKTRCHLLQCHLGMTDPRPVRLFKEYFGGRLWARFPKKKNWRPQLCWSISSRDDCSLFLVALLPYLIAKKDEAKIALEFIRDCPPLNGGQRTRVTVENLLERDEYKRRLQVLKRLDHDIA